MFASAQSSFQGRSRKWLRTTSLGVVCLVAGACVSYRGTVPISADRPGFIDLTPTVQPGAVQTEGGYTYNHAGDEEYQSVGETLVRFGLLPRAELRLHGNSYALRRNPLASEGGLEDARVGLKINVVGAPAAPSFVPSASVLIASSAPTGATTFGVSAWQPEGKLALMWSLPSRLTLATNVAVMSGVSSGDRFTRVHGGAALAFAATSKFAPYAGYYESNSGFPVDLRARYIDGGFGYLITDNVQFDVRGGFGKNSLPRDYFFGAGLSRRW